MSILGAKVTLYVCRGPLCRRISVILNCSPVFNSTQILWHPSFYFFLLSFFGYLRFKWNSDPWNDVVLYITWTFFNIIETKIKKNAQCSSFGHFDPGYTKWKWCQKSAWVQDVNACETVDSIFHILNYNNIQ